MQLSPFILESSLSFAVAMIHDIANEATEPRILLAVCAGPGHGGVVHHIKYDSAGPDVYRSGVIFFLVELFWCNVRF
jgi:hypothetical protein